MAIATELTINTAATALDMANAIFGTGITVSEAFYTGDPLASGIYSGALTTIPGVSSTDSGVILSTGRVADFTNSSGTTNTNTIAGTSTNLAAGIDGDTQLNAVAGMATFDGSILTATFTPDGDYLTMQFVFSSEEYPEYVNGNVNDAFGVWVNGNFVPVTITVAGNVAIDEVNVGKNENFYRNNTGDQFNTEMDGFTYTLSLKAPVLKGQANTIKIGIADGGDAIFDSNLLIMADSVQTVTLAMDDTINMVANTSRTFDILANDTQAGGANLTISQINGTNVVAGQTVTLTSGQQVRLNADGTVTVFANGVLGLENLSYTVSDGTQTDVGYIHINTSNAVAPDGIVSGTAGNDNIDTTYLGDPDGDRVDNNDATGVQGTTGNADVIYAGAGNDQVTAGAGNDIIDADSGDDTVFGGAGDDKVTLGSGNDSFGTFNADSAGNDTVYGDAGNDYIITGGDNDILYGGTGNDSLSGGVGSDTLYGGDGQDWFHVTDDHDLDTIVGGEGASDLDTIGFGNWNTLNGVNVTFSGNEAGTYTFRAAAPADVASSGIFSEIEAISGTDFSDNLDASAAATGKTLISGGGADTVTGGAGNDIINGGSGNDVLSGGAGNDTLNGDDASPEPAPIYSTVTGASGSVTGTSGAANFTYTSVSNEGQLTASDQPAVPNGYWVGNGDATEIHTHTMSRQVNGAELTFVNINAGEEVTILIDGAAVNLNSLIASGAVTFNPGSSGASVNAAGHLINTNANPGLPSTLTINTPFTTLGVQNSGSTGSGTAYDLKVDGNPVYVASPPGDDTIQAGIGADVVNAGGGNDSVFGDAGNDTLSGGAGNDRIDGGDGADSVYGDDGADSIYGGANDYILGGEGGDDNDSLFASNVVGLTYGGGNNEAGTLTFADGSSLTFAEIEHLRLNGGNPDGLIIGTSGNDSIGAGYVDGNGDVIDNNDAILSNPGSHDDEVYAGQGDDTITGLQGNDFLYAGEGNDSLDGGADNDYMQGDAGNDTVLGGVGNDFIRGDAGNDSVYGGLGDDSTYGGAGNDQVYAGDGADEAYGGFGNDTVYGGAGNDNITGSGDDDIVYGDAGDDTVHGSDGADTLYGGTGADTLLGEDDADTIYAEAGDYVDGGEVVTTGTDNDTLHVNNVLSVAFDTYNNETGVVTFVGGGTLNFYNIEHVIADGVAVLPPNFVVEGTTGADLIDAAYLGDPQGDRIDALDNAIGSNADNVQAGAGNDTVHAADGDDTIAGEAGDDDLFGGQGADLADGGIGNDSIYGGLGNDTALGADGNDSLSGAEGQDALYGGAGEDALSGGSEGDSLFGGADNDTLSGDVGDDTLQGDGGDDLLYGGDGADSISDSSGNDHIEGWLGNDTVNAGAGNDYVDGGDGDDSLSGGDGDDMLAAGSGNDSVNGGAGNDQMSGEGGDDSFALTNGFGTDTITGGESEETSGDTLNLTGLTGNVTVNLTGFDPEAGTVTTGGATATFTQIENIVLGTAIDTLVLADGSGADSVQGFTAPTDNGDGTFTGVDKLNVAGLTDAQGNPVNVNDVTVGDDGNGNAVLTFANGESLTLIGVAPAAVSNPAALVAMGIPSETLDFIVEGTAGADYIDTAYTGDPEGDRIDATDNLPSNNDDLVMAGAGDDTVHSTDGNDTVYGEDGNDVLQTGEGADLLYGGTGNDMFFTQSGSDTVYGGEGDDSAFASFDGDLVYGGGGNDVLEGGGYAANGHDTLHGDAGNDVLTGRLGNDQLYGGADSDIFRVQTPVDNDTIAGGEAGLDFDSVDLSGIAESVTVDFTGNEAGSITGTGTGTGPEQTIFSEIEGFTLTAQNDVFDASVTTTGTQASAGGGADTVTGGAGDDTLSGDAGNDLIFGGAGQDRLYGGAGNDTMLGGSGDDTLTGGEGDDSFALHGGFGNDSITGGETDESVGDTLSADQVTTDLVLNLGAGTLQDGTGAVAQYSEIENFVLGSGNDQVIGSAGNEVVATGAGSDTVNGGAGNDSFALGASDGVTDVVVFSDGDGADTIAQFEAPVLSGGSYTGRDVLDVGGLTDASGNPVNTNDVIVSADGNGNAVLTFPNGETITLTGIDPNTINNPEALIAMGIPGAPDLIVDGTAGNDYMDPGYTDVHGDIVDGADGDQDTIMGYDGNDTILAGAGDDLVDGGSGVDLVYGGLGNDTVFGQSGDDTIAGDAGDDLLDGGAGNDSLAGGIGNDVLIGASGNDILSGNAGNDTLAGGGGADTIFGGANDDVIDGGTEDDLIYGEDGADTLFGDAGNDTIDAGTGNDSVGAGDGDDTVLGGIGADSLYGDAGADSVEGGEGQDLLSGGAGNDTLSGQQGNDTLSGDAGDDLLDGGSGNDLLTGGDGADSLYGADDRDTLYGGMGDVVDGGEGGDDYDVLDLTAFGHPATNILYDTANPENGTVEFLDVNGDVVDTLTFTNIENVIACFTPGAMILTGRGEVPVEELTEGDVVLTRDSGFQTIRWIGRRDLSGADVAADARFAPVRIAKGALGNGLPARDVMVSPQHRMLMAGPRAELLFGEHEVLVAACHMVGMAGVERVQPSQGVSYLHILFDQHEIVRADGAWSESFQPGVQTLNGLGREQRAEILALFPDLAHDLSYPAARLKLKSAEARVLLQL